MALRKTMKMINIYPEPVRFQIDAGPGSGGVEFELGPNESTMIDENLCKPVPGAGQDELLPSIMARLTTRTWPDSDVRHPTIVPLEQADKFKAQVDKLLKNEAAKRKADAKKAAAAIASAAGGAA